MLCPQCGAAMAPTDALCTACGYQIGGGAGAAEPEYEAAAAVTAPPEPDAGPRVRAPGGPVNSGIKIRKDGPAPRADRPAQEHNLDAVPSAEWSSDGSDPGGRVEPGAPGVVRSAPQPAGAPVPGAKPAAPAPGTKQAPPVPRPGGVGTARTSAWSTAALVAGLLGFCLGPITGPLAILFGILGLRDVKHGDGYVDGAGRAKWGLGLGVFHTAMTVLVIGAFLAVGGVGSIGSLIENGGMLVNVAALEQLATTQEQFKAMTLADADHDGKGEYGTAEELTRLMDGVDLTQLQNGALGWKLWFDMPATANGRERAWAAFLEPVGAARDTKPWFFIDESKILRTSTHSGLPPTRYAAQRWDATSSDHLFETMMNG